MNLNVELFSELIEELSASTELRKGWVCFNDPFKRQMQIWTGEAEDGGPVKDILEFVDYCQLRLDTWVHSSKTVADVRTTSPSESMDYEDTLEPRRKVNVHFLLMDVHFLFISHNGSPWSLAKSIILFNYRS